MTKDEALDLALEALDNLLYWDNGKSDYDQAREAITAIKQARSAPVQDVSLIDEGKTAAPVQEPFGYFRYDMRLDAWVQSRNSNQGTAFYTTPPAQPAPVQEPVEGYPSNWAKVTLMISPKGEMHAISGDRVAGVGDTAYVGLERIKAAAQRKWVGLTQQDIDIAFDDTQEGGGFDDFARAIEAKLKEKNNG